MSFPVSNLFSEIRRQVPGAPDITMAEALVRAARKFCSETWYLRRTVIFPTVVGQPLYNIGPPPDQNEEILAVKLGQVTLPTGAGLTSTIRPLWFQESTAFDPNASQDVPVFIQYVPYNKVVVWPTPKIVATVALTVIVQPVLPSSTVPAVSMTLGDELGVKWYRGIAEGALGWLLKMEKEPWANLQLAKDYEVMAQTAIMNAKGEAMNNWRPGGVRVRPRPFIV